MWEALSMRVCVLVFLPAEGHVLYTEKCWTPQLSHPQGPTSLNLTDSYLQFEKDTVCLPISASEGFSLLDGSFASPEMLT